jgi:FkbM family methyltransferase
MKPSKQNSINNWLSVYLKYIFIKIINKINSISVRNKYIKERLKGLRLKLNYSNGMTMIIPYENLNNSFHPFSIYYEYLSELKKYYSEFKIDESDTCIDIGGHVGFLLVPIMIENPKIIYFCFEADKNNYNLLQDNILLNAINTRMISVKNVAISDIDGEQEFIEGKTSTTGRLETIKSYKIKNGERSYFGKNGRSSLIQSLRLDTVYK